MGKTLYPSVKQATLEELYLSRGLSSYSIADEMGCSPRLVRYWLQKYGIPTRSFGNQRRMVDRYQDADGYIRVKLDPSSPFYSMASAGWIFEHRLVMAQHLGRCLEPWELVHHKHLGIKNDNRIEKLELLSSSQHGNLLTVQLSERIKSLEQRMIQLEAENILLRAQVDSLTPSNL
jgi:hypothetical protein